MKMQVNCGKTKSMDQMSYIFIVGLIKPIPVFAYNVDPFHTSPVICSVAGFVFIVEALDM